MYSKSYKIRSTGNNVSSNDLLEIIAKELKRHSPTKIEQKEEKIEFSAGFRFLIDDNLLNQITSGTIEFREDKSCLVYSLSFIQLIVFGILATLFMTIVPLATGAPTIFLILGPLLVWGWLVGMNFLLGIFRFRSLIKRCIAKSSFEIVR